MHPDASLLWGREKENKRREEERGVGKNKPRKEGHTGNFAQEPKASHQKKATDVDTWS